MSRNPPNTALKSISQAFGSGFKAAMRGASISTCTFKKQAHIDAFEKGWRRYHHLSNK